MASADETFGTISASGTTYPDRRDEFVRVLWCKARAMTKMMRTDNKQARSSLIRAAVALALHPSAIRTCWAAERVSGVGKVWIAVLQANETKSGKTKLPTEPPVKGHYASPAVAALIALLEHTEHTDDASAESAHAAGDSPELEWQAFLDAAGVKLEGGRTFATAEQLKAGLDYCPAWEQVKQLMSTDAAYVQKRNRKGRGSGVAFQLTPKGRALAQRLRRQAASGGSRGAMLESAPGVAGPVRLLVDYREGGGERHKLSTMTNHLDHHPVPYEVRSLPVGDFLFQLVGQPRGISSAVSLPGRQLEAASAIEASGRVSCFPLLVERKSAADVALSMTDGRWAAQKKRMKEYRDNCTFSGVDEYGNRRHVDLIYIIEGSLKGARAGCCSKGCLAECGGPTLAEAEEEVGKLQDEGFEVQRTKGLAGTIAFLTAKASTLSQPFREAFAPSFEAAAEILTKKIEGGGGEGASGASGGGSGASKGASSRSVLNCANSSGEKRRAERPAQDCGSDSDIPMGELAKRKELNGKKFKSHLTRSESSTTAKSSGGGIESGSRQSDWACCICTFVNTAADAARCALCDNAKSQAAPAAPSSGDSESEEEILDFTTEVHEAEEIASSSDGEILDLVGEFESRTGEVQACSETAHMMKLKVDELKHRCKEAGLQVSGNKVSGAMYLLDMPTS